MSALSPAGALSWLASLSIDVRAAAVLAPSGAVLAGDAALGARTAALAARSPGHAPLRDGDLVAVRSARHTVVASLEPGALFSLHLVDLEAALDALDAG